METPRDHSSHINSIIRQKAALAVKQPDVPDTPTIALSEWSKLSNVLIRSAGGLSRIRRRTRRPS